MALWPWTGFSAGAAGSLFAYANHNPKLKSGPTFFYGPGPETKADAENIKCPVYGFYAEDDARIGATVPQTTEVMKSLGKTYQPVTYSGAGHGFMRAGEEPEAKPANAKARDDAWTRWKTLLKKLKG